MRNSVCAKMFGVIVTLMCIVGVAAAEDYSPNAGTWSGRRGSADFNTARAENQKTGELYADVLAGSVSIQREFRRTLPSIFSYSHTAHYQNRADAGFASDDAYASTAEVSSSVYDVCPTTMCSPGANWVMWDVPWLMRETSDAEDGYMGYRSTSSGFATGVSYMLGESSAVGLAVGYDTRTLRALDHYHQKNNADTLHLALFGGTNIGNLFIDGYAGWSRAWNRAERTVENGLGNGAVLKSNFDDDVVSLGLKASYVWVLPNEVRITPSIGFDFSYATLAGFSERTHSNTLSAGYGDYALNADDSTFASLAVPIAVSINKTFEADFLTFKGARSLWTPEMHAGWTPQFGQSNATAKLGNDALTGGRTLSTRSNTLADSYGTIGAGLKIKLADKFIFGVEYDYMFAGDYDNHSLTGMYGVSF